MCAAVYRIMCFRVILQRDEAATNSRNLKMRWVQKADIMRLLLSVGVSAFALGLLLRMTQSAGGHTLPLLRAAWLGMPVSFFLLYGVAQLVQGGARAARYRLLLRAGAQGKAPPWYPMVLVTFVRNMFVDMLPARLGELMYVGMLKTGCRIRSEAGLASMGVSILVDLVALAVVLLAALLSLMGPTGGAISTLIVIIIVALVGWGTVFYVPGPIVRQWRQWAGPSPKWRMHDRILVFATQLADELTALRQGRALGAALAWSVLIRISKYGGLLALFYGVTHQLWPDLHAAPVGKLLIGLIAAEGAAALPIPTFMAFGAYEAGGVGALALLGADPAHAALAMLALHIASQAVDYTLGLVAWVLFLVYARDNATTSASVVRHRSWNRPRVAIAGIIGMALLLSLLAITMRDQRSRRQESTGAPGQGEAVVPDPDANAVLRQILDGRTGFVVWSSNRFGHHAIVRRRLPDGPVEPLTEHANTDTYPRISPCGARLVFSRSQVPWVSQRNPEPWDVYMLDIADGRETLIAQDGFMPAWTAAGNAIVFVRGGKRVIHVDLETGDETELAAAGKRGIPEDTKFQTPDYHAESRQLAVTLRGAFRATAVLHPERSPQVIGGGCQLSWMPGQTWLYYVKGSRRRANVFRRAEPDGSGATIWFAPPAPFDRAYFPQLSTNGEFAVFGAAASGHEHDQADYEIFIWRVDDPAQRVARLTWHTGNDCWPDVWIDR
ncbi:MAG: hypothetical protein EA424_03290 [Planctomycetaceae bacterium]|nr:MAG: hypothetical protein EA424_03290 [Planctomycetaceae bacterium]